MNLKENRGLLIAEGIVTLLWLVMITAGVFYPSTLLTLVYLWFLAWAAVKRPRWLPAVLVAVIPLEVSKQFISVLIMKERVAGFTASVLDFFRLAQAALGLRWLYDLRKRSVPISWRLFKKDSLIWLFGALLGVYLFSTAFSLAPKQSLAESVRLVSMLVTLYLGLIYLPTKKDLWLVGQTLIVTGTVLGLIAIGEYISGHFFFNVTPAVLINRRANATFADPNILARFLVVTFLFAVAELERQDTWFKRLRALAAIVVQGAGLGITGSRGGLLALAGAMVIFAILVPRRRFTLSAMLLMVVAMIGAAATNPVIMRRLESLSKGVLSASGGIREYLWRVGIAMVRDHPLIGIGVGTFGTAFMTLYPYFNPYSTFYVTLSHTAVMTVLAETGIIGFTVLYFIFAKTLQRGWDLLRRAQDDQLRFLSASIVAGVVAIFISAQGEGRLYEEPLLWLLWAMLITITRLERNTGS